MMPQQEKQKMSVFKKSADIAREPAERREPSAPAMAITELYHQAPVHVDTTREAYGMGYAHGMSGQPQDISKLKKGEKARYRIGYTKGRNLYLAQAAG